jgi:hypothetical protein
VSPPSFYQKAKVRIYIIDVFYLITSHVTKSIYALDEGNIKKVMGDGL